MSRHRDRPNLYRSIACGSAVALALGAYAVLHEPTARDFVFYGFDSAASWKHAFTVLAALLFVAQAALAIKLAQLFGCRATGRPWLWDLRRLLATLAVGFSLPVAFHCIWVLGFRTDDLAITAHSIAGCVAYGVVVAAILGNHTKMVRSPAGPRALTHVVGATQYVVGVGAATAVLLGFTLQGSALPTAIQPTPLASTVDAEALYGKHCANCHANDGSGGIGTPLAGVVVDRYPNAAEQSAVVASGRNQMPAFESVLTPAETAAITNYTRTAWD